MEGYPAGGLPYGMAIRQVGYPMNRLPAANGGFQMVGGVPIGLDIYR